MKQGELKRRIQRAADAQGKVWRLVRQGGRHEVRQCGDTKVTIPRHREINEFTAEAIYRAVGEEVRSRMVEKMKLKTYTAHCRRVGDWWAISVPELKGVNTQARRLEKADAMVRDAIALFLDVPADSFDIKIEPILPRDLQKKVGRARKVRVEAEVLQAEAVTVSAAVAADLVQRAHLTVRDAGRVLGISHQRIAQLLKAGSGEGRRVGARAVRTSRQPR